MTEEMNVVVEAPAKKTRKTTKTTKMRLSEQRTELVKVILEREHFIVLIKSLHNI